MGKLTLRTLTGTSIFVGDYDIPDDPTTHMVWFNPTGGETLAQTIEVGHNSTLSDIPTASLDGYTFLGWFDQLEGGNKLTEQTRITQDITFYAHWEQVSQIRQYVLTFDGNGKDRTEVKYISVYPGETGYVGTLPVWTREGYSQIGWYDSPEGGNPISSYTVVDRDMTIYAHWKKKQVKITYYYDTVSQPQYKYVDWGQPIGEIIQFERTGYTFEGWFTNSVGGEPVSFDQPVYEDIRIFARYSIIEYPIIYNMNGHGTPNPTNLQTYNIQTGGYTPLPADNINGWAFSGWNPESIPADSIGEFTFTANWTEDSSAEPTPEPDPMEELQEEFDQIDEEYPIPEDLPTYSDISDALDESDQFDFEEGEVVEPIDTTFGEIEYSQDEVIPKTELDVQDEPHIIPED